MIDEAKSPTPRTDAENAAAPDDFAHCAHMIEFCRTLERELAAAQAELERKRTEWCATAHALARCRDVADEGRVTNADNARLRAALADASCASIPRHIEKLSHGPANNPKV